MTDLSLLELRQSGICHTVIGDERVRVRGVKHDSRRVEPGDLFVAIDGVQQVGARFVEDAVARGAVAVASVREVATSVPVCVTHDAETTLFATAHRLYDDPTAALRVVGITGTNGKTTTAYLLEEVLRDSGVSVALSGTIQMRTPKTSRDASLTTPMADDLVRFAAEARRDGADCLVMEVSSHALAMQRVGGVRFEVAAFTNLTQDHLDYHGDMLSYEQTKTLLFTDYAPRTSIVNVDDPAGARIAAQARSERVWRCSTKPDADAEIRAVSWQSTRDGLLADVETPHGKLSLRSPLVGKHNLENLLIVVATALALGVAPESIQAGVAVAIGAPGRLESVRDPRGVLVLVDYAHTPDALVRVLEALRPLTTGRLFAVFGCGGDRDASKRPLMGRAVGEAADIAVVTSDNPRTESAELILRAIEPGVRDAGLPACEVNELRAATRGYVIVSDRARAIELAIENARSGDTVLIAGKGHETFQIIGTERLPFDDRDVAARAIHSLGGC